jgi:hypothetical protein
VKRGIRGRLADECGNTALVVQAALLSGPGDHVEIGTLFGGSAIAVALAKERRGLAGAVYCIDPLDGYYLGTPFAYPVDPVIGEPICEATVRQNAQAFGVSERFIILRKRSSPWPEELQGREFVSAYIDGDHWGQGPLDDWYNVCVCTTGYVVFDNCDAKHPDVVRACDLAGRGPVWREVYRAGITCILAKEAGDGDLE